MGKSTEIKLVGQPIMGQLLNLIDKPAFGSLVKKLGADHYYKAFKSWDHLATMLFGTLSRCDSMGEICEGMRGLSGKLNQLGMKKAPAKSSAGDGLRNRDSGFFEALYYQLVKQHSGFLSDSRTLVWCTLIAQLLLTVLQNMAKVKKAFSMVATLVRIHLISMLDVYELLRSTKREWASPQATEASLPIFT